jgi:hypothetical protein
MHVPDDGLGVGGLSVHVPDESHGVGCHTLRVPDDGLGVGGQALHAPGDGIGGCQAPRVPSDGLGVGGQAMHLPDDGPGVGGQALHVRPRAVGEEKSVAKLQVFELPFLRKIQKLNCEAWRADNRGARLKQLMLLESGPVCLLSLGLGGDVIF